MVSLSIYKTTNLLQWKWNRNAWKPRSDPSSQKDTQQGRETKKIKFLGVVFDRTSHLMIIQYKRLVCQKNLKISVLYELNKKFS